MSKGGCLVIGGGGFVGAQLVTQLLATGRRVSVVGRRAAPLSALPQQARYFAGDFGDLELIRRLLETHEEVIHLAYATVPNTSFANPLADLLQNLPPTVQLFTEMAARGRKLLLVSSGGTVYGEAISLPITESHPTQPISPYGVTKLTLEKYAYLYSVTHGLHVVCVRPANAYGEGQRPFVGQGFIATAMAAAMQGKPITIFGRHGVVRDYIHVSDLAAGLVRALEKGTSGEIYNVGSGVGRSNLEVLEAMAPLLREQGHALQIEYAPERVFDVQANVLDSSKLRQQTSWQPQISFEEGLLRARDWLGESIV
jgi:UDP-glucose 4-epimerase